MVARPGKGAVVTPRSGPYLGCVVNPDTGRPILTDTDQIRRADFKKAKLSEVLLPEEGSPAARRPLFSPLWQADGSKVRRYAPVDFLSRYLSDGFFDYDGLLSTDAFFRKIVQGPEFQRAMSSAEFHALCG